MGKNANSKTGKTSGLIINKKVHTPPRNNAPPAGTPAGSKPPPGQSPPPKRSKSKSAPVDGDGDINMVSQEKPAAGQPPPVLNPPSLPPTNVDNTAAATTVDGTVNMAGVVAGAAAPDPSAAANPTEVTTPVPPTSPPSHRSAANSLTAIPENTPATGTGKDDASYLAEFPPLPKSPSRETTAVDADDDDDEVMEVVDPESLPRNPKAHLSRYNLQFDVPASKDPVMATRTKLQDFMDVLFEVDKGAVLYPWRQADFRNESIPYLDDADNLPMDPQRFRIYFQRVRWDARGRRVYTDIYVGHELSRLDFEEQLEFPLSQGGFKLFYSQLQCENPEFVGWGLYSLPGMDLGPLSLALKKHLGCDVGLRWKLIYYGWNNSTNSKEEGLPVRALHFELDSDNPAFNTQKRTLAALYKTGKTAGFPLGIRMRYIPTYNYLSSPKQRAKVQTLAARQEGFVSIVQENCWHISFDIANLDLRSSEIGLSLRTVLMRIPSPKDPCRPLFHCINHTSRNGIKFSFLPDVSAFATSVIKGLLPYLKFKHPAVQHKGLESFFRVAYCEECRPHKWDPVEGAVLTDDDKCLAGFDLDAADTVDRAYLFDNIELVKTKESEKESAAEQAQAKSLTRRIMPKDDDISSIGSGTSRKSSKTRASGQSRRKKPSPAAATTAAGGTTPNLGARRTDATTAASSTGLSTVSPMSTDMGQSFADSVKSMSDNLTLLTANFGKMLISQERILQTIADSHGVPPAQPPAGNSQVPPQESGDHPSPSAASEATTQSPSP